MLMRRHLLSFKSQTASQGFVSGNDNIKIKSFRFNLIGGFKLTEKGT